MNLYSPQHFSRKHWENYKSVLLKNMVLWVVDLYLVLVILIYVHLFDCTILQCRFTPLDVCISLVFKISSDGKTSSAKNLSLKRPHKKLATENPDTLFIVAYLNSCLIHSKTSISNKSSFSSKQKMPPKKTQIYIWPHIPVLVYCQVFTNVCFSKDICTWKATRIHSYCKSHNSPCWALKQTDQKGT